MGDSWWLNPYKWVDEGDLVVGGELRLGRAIAVLTDTMVMRPTDQTVMVNGVAVAVKTAGLTRRQSAALEVARLAVNQTATIAVAKALDINRHSAYKLLQRAGAITPNREQRTSTGTRTVKMETSERKFAIGYSASVSETDIQRVLGGMYVACVACGKKGCRPRYCLCRECWELYGSPDKRAEVTRRWLDPLISMARSQARKDAIEMLHRADWDDDERRSSA